MRYEVAQGVLCHLFEGEKTMTEDERTCEILLIARTYMYTLFHKAFGGEPTAELLELLGGDELNEVMAVFAEEDDTIAKCRSYLTKHFSAEHEESDLLKQCVSEYVSVVYGFPKASALPSESFYCSSDHSQLTEVTLAVRDSYRNFGLLPVRYQRTPDDSLALEMDFMAHLAADAAEAFALQDWAMLVSLLQAQASFLDKHLGAWLSDFAADMRRVEQAYLYPQLTQAAEAFICLDRQCLNNIAAWLTEKSHDGEASEASETSVTDASACLRLVQALNGLKTLRLPHLEEGELTAIVEA